MAFMVLLAVSCHQHPTVDPLLRSRADGLNRQAFLERYRDPNCCLVMSDSALRFIADSLPDYDDGVLRALNNKAFAYYQTTRYPEALAIVEMVEQLTEDSPTPNSDIELMISHLLKARLLQRSCNIAESYRLLYDIGRSHVLEHSRNNLLFNYAQSEYYITMLTLNFHYRNGKEADVMQLIREVEERRADIKVDYAQDMALNYALAYGLQSAGESMEALDYCDLNMQMLERPDAFCLYHYANTLQMMALALKSIPGVAAPDSVLALYDEALKCFTEYGDPYQMLGGVISTARYAMLIGDTLKAHDVLNEWRANRHQWKPFSAPKMEIGYFEVMLHSRITDNPDDMRRWFDHYCELKQSIADGEREDFRLQLNLASAQRSSRWKTVFIVTLAVVAAILSALLSLLWLSALRLRREKQQLEEANRRDVERIANVEMALSVMRHDISPFIGYLSNEQLSPELRNEVTGQLLRTFDNLKRWTNLSIPAGMSFTPTVFPLQPLFDEVRNQTPPPAEGVELRFEPTKLSLWGDHSLVVILLRNLVGNALKHTTQGSVTVSAAVEEGVEGMIHLRVADTGSGMTADQQEELFRADRTLPPGADHGFGLILCRYIVRRHDDQTRRGCRIWVESQEGTGTTMHCLLATKGGFY